jgi:glucose/arabinose dehydrogenase
MKRFPVLLLGFIGFGVILLLVAWPQVKGLKPVLTPAPQSIAGLIANNQTRPPQNQTDFPLKLPNNFTLSLFAENLGNPRVLKEDPQGTLVVSLTQQGKVVALPDKDQNGRADRQVVLVENLNNPHGLAFRCTPEATADLPQPAKSCSLYIAETNQVSVYAYDPGKLQAQFQEKVVDLPGSGGHFTRTLLFLSPPEDGKLLISVGSSCNVCEETDGRRSKVLVYDTQTDELTTFASGLRNAVFLAIHPQTHQVWVTEMGRDQLGDDLPPDEINIVREGRHYGWPYCYGKQIPDQAFLPGTDTDADFCRSTEPSHLDLQAHSAPLGLAFFPQTGWPQEYQHDLLVAYHGSWNRTAPTGYKLVRFRLDEQGNYQGQEDFITGWLTKDNLALGRPVDILIHEGSILISDDRAGVIYRVIRE